MGWIARDLVAIDHGVKPHAGSAPAIHFVTFPSAAAER